MSARGRNFFEKWKGCSKGLVVLPVEPEGRVTALHTALELDVLRTGLPMREIEEEVGDVRQAISASLPHIRVG